MYIFKKNVQKNSYTDIPNLKIPKDAISFQIFARIDYTIEDKDYNASIVYNGIPLKFDKELNCSNWQTNTRLVREPIDIHSAKDSSSYEFDFYIKDNCIQLISRIPYSTDIVLKFKLFIEQKHDNVIEKYQWLTWMTSMEEFPDY